MGKIRVKKLGDAEQEKKQKAEAKKRIEAKKSEKKADNLDSSSTKSEGRMEKEFSTPLEQEQTQSSAKQDAAPQGKAKKAKFAKKKHSDGYQQAAELVEAKKLYSLSEALALLPKLKRAKFDEAVELHITTESTGVTVSTVLPNGTGKDVRVAIANEAIIAEIEKGQINFDVLVAEPSMMPKLAKVAKVLGPRGLMPNPKNGTVSPKPEEAAKKFQGGQVHFKTEAKFPLLHMIVGKVSFGDEKLAANIKAVADVLPAKQVKNATLKLTMSPAIHVDYMSI